MTNLQHNDFSRPIKISILGVRGIPASHGGFETFVERLAPHLISLGWDVTVYCQEDPSSAATRQEPVWRSTWAGVNRVHIRVPADTPYNTIRFDLKSISHVIAERPDVVLVLGYNTAIFTVRLRSAGITTVINMDGIEWSRSKWSPMAKAWLYVNEWAGCLFADHLIADHPQIGRHLQSRAKPGKISVIPYGADLIDPATDDAALQPFGLISMRYATVIARAEPENSILEIVSAFSARARDIKLVVLGKYFPDRNQYHKAVMDAAGSEVIFPGAIYDKDIVRALRRHSLLYLHGHRVGGCNPSLLEAMGAGNSVIAHDNRFNRWVAGAGALYFTDRATCEQVLDEQLQFEQEASMRRELNRRRAAEVFNWNEILQSYTELLRDLSTEVDADANRGLGRRPTWQINTDAS